jgi:iron-sulfur cluster insertion protein
MSSTPIPISFDDDQKEEEKVYNFDHGKDLDLTEDAIAKVKSYLESNEKAKGKRFRVYVEGGGCSGMQYGFTFDDKVKDDDHMVKCGDLEVLVDAPSLIYIKGAVVDYVDSFSGAGFIVKNPLSKGECGCGVSFTV